jgi:hypothetical protein
MKKNKMNNFPMVQPMNQLMMGGFPGVPDIFRDAFPQNLPSLPFETGIIRRKLHKWKVRDLVEIKQLEADGAAADASKFTANMTKITEAIMFGPKIMNMHHQINHDQTMRDLLEKKAQAEVAKIQYETAILANEAKLGDLEVRAKEKQYRRILKDDDAGDGEN